MDDPALLWEKDAVCTQNVGSVDACLVETCGLYNGEFTALKFSVPVRRFRLFGPDSSWYQLILRSGPVL